MGCVKEKPLSYYVYHDADHSEIEVFTTLAKAKAHAELCWPQCTETLDDDSTETYPIWESNPDKWFWGEYVTIYKKKIKA